MSEMKHESEGFIASDDRRITHSTKDKRTEAQLAVFDEKCRIKPLDYEEQKVSVTIAKDLRSHQHGVIDIDITGKDGSVAHTRVHVEAIMSIIWGVYAPVYTKLLGNLTDKLQKKEPARSRLDKIKAYLLNVRQWVVSKIGLE